MAVITGSVSVLAQMADSSLTFCQISLTYFAVLMGQASPPTPNTPSATAKVENVSVFIQAILIFGAGAAIVYSAINKLINGVVVGTAAGWAQPSMAVGRRRSQFSAGPRKMAGTGRDTDSPALLAIAHTYIRADI